MKGSIPEEFPLDNCTVVEAKFCFSLYPPMINSHGILNDKKALADFLKYSFPLLELQMGIICILYQALHYVLKQFGITRFASQITAGIILGPTFLGRYDFMRQVVFPLDSQDLIYTAAELGLQIFLFLSAVKLEAGMVIKKGKIIMFSGIGIVMLPMILGSCVLYFHKEYLSATGTVFEGGIVVVMQCFTTLSIIAHVLDELKLANSEIGRLALSSACIGDMLGLVIMSVTSAVLNSSARNFFLSCAVVICYALVAAFIFGPSVSWILRHTTQGSPVCSSYIYLIMILVIASEIYFSTFQQVRCIGPILLGLAIPAGSPLGSALVDKFESFISGVLIPLHVTASIMRADLTLIVIKSPRTGFYLALISLPFIAKVSSCLIPSLYWKMPLIDSIVFSIIMTSRGIIELTAYAVARDFMLIGKDVFAILVLSLFINSIIVGVLVKNFYDPSRKYAGYQARNITSLKPKSELRILACIHNPDNITSTIRLLDSFHPDRVTPVDVYVLHLIQLIGRATPIFISHQNQKPIHNSSSQNVIVSFNQFMQKNWDCVSVSIFTAISPSISMNEDISILALDKLISLILLPLHRKWSIHGRVVAEDNNIRTINCKILEKAPSSVAIFFDRGKLGRRDSMAASGSFLSICMIFLGGDDDREALSLAKRIANDSNAHLKLLHFVPEYAKMDSEDKIIETWSLKQIKESAGQNEATNITYEERKVKDGPETALQIHSIADEYDLFLVGRRHGVQSPQTAGLSQWTELPELGIIGDLLASKDTNTRAAVLVVQRQKEMK